MDLYSSPSFIRPSKIRLQHGLITGESYNGNQWDKEEPYTNMHTYTLYISSLFSSTGFFVYCTPKSVKQVLAFCMPLPCSGEQCHSDCDYVSMCSMPQMLMTIGLHRAGRLSSLLLFLRLQRYPLSPALTSLVEFGTASLFRLRWICHLQSNPRRGLEFSDSSHLMPLGWHLHSLRSKTLGERFDASSISKASRWKPGNRRFLRPEISTTLSLEWVVPSLGYSSFLFHRTSCTLHLLW